MIIRKVPYTMKFNFPAGTSRGVLLEKKSWFIHIENDGLDLFGECGPLQGLSLDDKGNYEAVLDRSLREYKDGILDLSHYNEWPSIKCGWEMLLLKLESGSDFTLWDCPFIEGHPIDINGLIWMGDSEFMKSQIQTKLEKGFTCLKMKIGALDFDSEIAILKKIRRDFPSSEIELRVDANGAFSPDIALEKLNILSSLDIHSIEQPILPGQWEDMAKLCEESPIPIALDEELIPIIETSKRKEMLKAIKPAYIILKPSLIGGFKSADEWIELSKEIGCDWWATSALESNIGLNAIAQWCSTKNLSLPQGLGTGSLYENNIESPLQVKKGQIIYDKNKSWNLNPLIHA
ncbi:MAG: o-succinylbenzoate synthase [Flavobacteriales bacterium]|nr:o-succinylbenzoate synthase [Flavobacteriales bacterium]